MKSMTGFGNIYLFAGRRMDQATGTLYFRHRHMEVRKGRFLTRDPLHYIDGNILYPYVLNNPITITDPMGLLTWVNKKTITNTTGIVKNPLGNWGRAKLPASKLALTLPRARILFSCCCKGFFNWVLCATGMTVEFHIEIILQPAYVSPAQRAWVLRAENDHVKDFMTWANGPGKKAAIKTETKLLSKSYWTKDECAQDVRNTMGRDLLASVNLAVKATIAAHDAKGKHRWGGPNQRR